jgi:hypothetical protein
MMKINIVLVTGQVLSFNGYSGSYFDFLIRLDESELINLPGDITVNKRHIVMLSKAEDEVKKQSSVVDLTESGEAETAQDTDRNDQEPETQEKSESREDESREDGDKK